jgi:hypothetical protein
MCACVYLASTCVAYSNVNSLHNAHQAHEARAQSQRLFVKEVADAGKVDPPITSSDFHAAVSAAKGRAEELYRRVLFVGPDGRSSNAYVEENEKV